MGLKFGVTGLLLSRRGFAGLDKSTRLRRSGQVHAASPVWTSPRGFAGLDKSTRLRRSGQVDEMRRMYPNDNKRLSEQKMLLSSHL
jgi:hypothetical protein